MSLDPVTSVTGYTPPFMCSIYLLSLTILSLSIRELSGALVRPLTSAAAMRPCASSIDVKKRFYVFFKILVTFFTFSNVFIFQTFFIFKKTLAKFRAASRLTNSTSKITAIITIAQY